MSKEFYKLCLKQKELNFKFKRIFKFDFPLQNGVFFNVLELEKLLGVPDNISMTDFITEKYGKEANELVDDLIDLHFDFLEKFACQK